MAFYAMFIALFFLCTCAVECQKTCFLKYKYEINALCDVSEQNPKNITWSLLDTESNKTWIINICEATICHPLIPKLADVLFLASVTSDDSGRFIATSTLHANVKYANLTRMSAFSQLQCQYEDKIITVCDSFDVHVDPTTLLVKNLFISNRGDEFDILAKTDTLFPIPECTLYVDNMPVELNSSLVMTHEFVRLFDRLYSNPESDNQFDYVYDYVGACVYELNVTELGHGPHQFQISASAKTSDQVKNVVTTDVMDVSFDWPRDVVPVCNYPEFVYNNVILTCRSEVLSSTVGCEFEIRTNGSSSRVIYNTDSKLTHADLLGVPKLVTECKATWNKTYLGPGYHEFRVSVVTNNTMGNVTKFPSPFTTPLTFSPFYDSGCIYQEVSEEAVIISCRENLTSDAVGCEYQIKTNGTANQVKGDTNLYQYAEKLNETSSTISECNLTVNPRELGLGYHQFRLTMVTNDTNGNSTRRNFDLTSPLYFYLPEVNSRPEMNALGTNGKGQCTCYLKSQGYPRGSLRWTWVMRNGTFFTGEPGANQLTFTSQSLAENKNFSCQPLSVLIDNLPMLYVDLVVNQKQQLLNFTANGQDLQLAVDIGSYVTLECLASGYPTPGVKFRHEGTDGFMATRSRFYTFKVASCLDGGTYICSLKQWHAYQTLETKIEIFVKCPQMIRNAIEYPRQFYGDLKGNLEVTIPVSGYPEPNHYTLLRHDYNQTVVATIGYRASYHWGDYPDGTVVLSFTGVRDDHFTNYTLVFGNGMGTDQEYRFYLTKVNEPEGSDSDTNVGAIVGGVIGGVAAVVLIIVVIYFVNRSLKHKGMQSMKSNNYVYSNGGISAKQ